jgi:hypothetical protein
LLCCWLTGFTGEKNTSKSSWQQLAFGSCYCPADSAAKGTQIMSEHRVFSIKFAAVYPLYLQKAERKGRTKAEVDQVICWLTGYSAAELQQQLEHDHDFRTFFAMAPQINPKVALIKGVVCGVRVEELTDPLMQKIRYLDKLIDELAKGKTMEKILR